MLIPSSQKKRVPEKHSVKQHVKNHKTFIKTFLCWMKYVPQTDKITFFFVTLTKKRSIPLLKKK